MIRSSAAGCATDEGAIELTSKALSRNRPRVSGGGHLTGLERTRRGRSPGWRRTTALSSSTWQNYTSRKCLVHEILRVANSRRVKDGGTHQCLTLSPKRSKQTCSLTESWHQPSASNRANIQIHVLLRSEHSLGQSLPCSTTHGIARGVPEAGPSGTKSGWLVVSKITGRKFQNTYDERSDASG